MFNSIESSSLLKNIIESRLTDAKSSDIILDEFMTQHDFGHGFFHKILTKSILAPNSAKQEDLAS